MTRRSRLLGYGSAAGLVAAGGVCAATIGGGVGAVLALVLIGVGLVLAVSLVFYEVGLGEDQERAREERARTEASVGRPRTAADRPASAAGGEARADARGAPAAPVGASSRPAPALVARWAFTAPRCGSMPARSRSYLCAAASGAWYLWRGARRSRWLTIRSVDGSWSKSAPNAHRAERVALAGASHAPLEILDGTGKVIGRLGFDLTAQRRVVR